MRTPTFNKNEYMRSYSKKYRSENKERLTKMNLEYKEKNKDTLKIKRAEYAKKESVASKVKIQVWAKKLKNRYGLETYEYVEMLRNQKELCKICGLYKPLHVDHCHKTKRVRGLLCGNCNRGLGSFKDDVELLKSAIIYLNKWDI